MLDWIAALGMALALINHFRQRRRAALTAKQGVLYANLLVFSCCFALQNFGPSLGAFSLPSSARGGASMKIGKSETAHFNLAADLGLPTADPGAYSAGFGAEGVFQSNYAVRAGYKLSRSGSLHGGPSAGLGYRSGRMEINYALSYLGDLGAANQIEWTMNFGGS